MFEKEQAALQQRIEEIKKSYEPRFEELTRRGKDLERSYEKPSVPEAGIGARFKVDWKDVDIVFDLPSITVKDVSFALDLPEISSAQQKIVIDVPSTRMVDKKVGQYPEFHGPFTIVWKDIIISVPEAYMQRIEMVYDLPSVTMKRKEFILGVPQISMVRQHWTVGLPQFTLIDIKAEAGEIKKKGEHLKSEAETMASTMKAEIDAEIANFKNIVLARGFSAKTEIGNSFDTALGTIKTAIEDLQARKVDPIKVPTPTGDVNLRKSYEEVLEKKTKALAEVDKAVGATNK